jgi:hypothetical protein
MQFGKPMLGESSKHRSSRLKANALETAPRATATSKRLPQNKWLPVPVIQRIVDVLTKPLGHKPEIIILDSEGVLFNSLYPSDVAQQMISPDTKPTSGIVLEGKIYSFRDALDSNIKVGWTLWHELLHYSIRQFMIEAQYQYITEMKNLAASVLWVGKAARE